MAVKLYKEGIYNFPDKIKGDSFAFAGNPIQFNVRKPTIQDPDNTLSTVRCMFRDASGNIVKTISETDGITIVNSTTWLITIDIFTINWEAGKYTYDIETTDSEGIIDTFARGKIEIIEEVTYI